MKIKTLNAKQIGCGQGKLSFSLFVTSGGWWHNAKFRDIRDTKLPLSEESGKERENEFEKKGWLYS